jgi:hypothetical protein
MKSPATFRKYSSAGIDWAAWILGIGLGLTLALQLTTMSHSDISSVYSVVASVSRATALMVTGVDGAGWFAQPELAEYSAWVIDRHSGGAWGVGPAVLD